MCTYNISIDDVLLERVRPAFADEESIGKWMQSQIVSILQQMIEDRSQSTVRPKLSQRLRGIASHAPKDFDYKKELESRF